MVDARGDAVALMAYSLLVPADAPKPVPPAPGVCPDCNGTGKVGDGTVFKTCKTCDGTGKVGNKPIMPVPAVAVPAPPQRAPPAGPLIKDAEPPAPAKAAEDAGVTYRRGPFRRLLGR